MGISLRKQHRLAVALLLGSLAVIVRMPGNASASPAAPSLPSVQALADGLPCTVDFFEVNGRPAFLLRPKDRIESDAMPWVWYAPVIGHPNRSHAWMLRQWLEKGIGMAGVDVGESFGSPKGRKVYSALWETLTSRYGMSKRPCLLPQSRGGLMLYNWAAENPRHVACIAGIYTVCDLRSYPGTARACGAYGLRAAELEARLADHNPIDRLRPLAEAGVPVLHVHGDADKVVPLEENSAELTRRYRELGGQVRLIAIPGKGHQVCPEFFECQELVDFVVGHSRTRAAESGPANKRVDYSEYVRICLDTLMDHGTDRYGEVRTPMLASILDTQTLSCPEAPAQLDESFRVTRRDRRNPAAADLETDQALLKTMVLFSAATGDQKYADFAQRYADYSIENLADDQGFFWWGWHRRYDVYEDSQKGHSGEHHELHAIHEIDWEHLWKTNAEAVSGEIDAIWQWHVVDKQTGETNRHGDGQRGCDFSMSAGAFIEAFAFMHDQTGQRKWLDRARLLADYYWDRRNPETDLFPERPNAGQQRFDGSSFVTAITGLYCHSLLKAWQLTGDDTFRDHALAYLKAYAKYGYDAKAGKFWGTLHLDGTPILGPRLRSGYAAYEPRGHLELWEPYVAGYQFAIYTAQAYAYAYQLTGDDELLTAAKRFADWIERTPPGTFEGHENAWYNEYANGPGKQGTYAGKYGRSVSFYLNMFLATGDDVYLERGRAMADDAIEKLWHNGLFRGHPAKPYYESIDGVGYLLYAIFQLDLVLDLPQAALANKAMTIDYDNKRIVVSTENW